MKKTSVFAKIGNWFKKERDKLRPLTGKQRWEYFRMYYLLPLLFTVFSLVIIISAVTTMIINMNKETMLYIHMADKAEQPQDAWVQTYSETRGFRDNQEIFLSAGQYSEDNALYTYSVSVYAASKSLDVLVCDDANLDAMLKMNLAEELTEILDPQVLSLVGERLVWKDVILNDAADNEEQIPLQGNLAIDITGTPFAETVKSEGSVYLVVVIGSPRIAEIQEFIQYVLTE